MVRNDKTLFVKLSCNINVGTCVIYPMYNSIDKHEKTFFSHSRIVLFIYFWNAICLFCKQMILIIYCLTILNLFQWMPYQEVILHWHVPYKGRLSNGKSWWILIGLHFSKELNTGMWILHLWLYIMLIQVTGVIMCVKLMHKKDI